jgi:hypothetical protein
MQSCDGNDTANVSIEKIDTNSFDIHIDEEQSKDDETHHTTESVGYMVFNH